MFTKGHISWNKGLTGFNKGCIPWNKGKVGIKTNNKGHIAWNKGTKGVMKSWSKGKKGIYSEATLLKMHGWRKGKKPPNWEKFKATIKLGKEHPNWKGGNSQTNEYKRVWLKEHRHKLGISKKYRGEYTGISNTKEYQKLERQRRKALFKGGGELSVKTIQLVYEDNIKQYGTLTCYLCLHPIPFGKDTLEHKIPLSRGGTNEYNNLGIACQSCNCKKHNKTEEEFRAKI